MPAGLRIIEDLWRDQRLAVRSLRATPMVTGVAILSLALAIGANTALFSILNGLLLRTLPVRDPAGLALVTDSDAAPRARVWSHAVWEHIRQRPQLFDAAAAWSATRFNLASGGETQFVDGLWASGSFFGALGVRAVLGRTLSEHDDERSGGPDGPVALISYGYWQRQFGGAADVIGRSVRLNAVPFTIVGVTPPEFFGVEVGRTFEVIVPLATESLVRGRDAAMDSPGTNYLSVIARLRHGQTLDAATAELRGIQSEMREATLGPWGKDVVDRYLTKPLMLLPAATGFSNLRLRYERPLLILASVVVLVLLIACVNVANLLLARAVARRHELQIRLALGATRWRLARQLLTESLVLSALGAAMGLFVAAYSSDFIVGQLSTPATRVFLDVSLDGTVLAFTIALTVATALLFGTVPAFQAARVEPMGAIKDQGRATGGLEHSRLSGGLVVVQVALSVVLVVAAGLFIRSFVSLASRPLGLHPDPVLVVSIDPPQAVDPSERVALYGRARDAVLRLSNVDDAAISHRTPVGGGGFTPPLEIAGIARSGRPEAPHLVPANGDVFGNLISPGWFSTFGIRIVSGRDFTDGDRQGAPRVAVVNERFAARFLASGSPLGRTITVYPNTPRALSMEIVGVASDAVYTSPHEAAPPTWLVPIAQFDVPGFPFAPMRLSVRARSGPPAQLTKSVAAALATVHPQLTLTFRPLAEQIHASLTQERLMAQLGGFFGALALLLAGLGLYGVTAYAVSRRRTEIGIRMALGAAPPRVIGLVLSRVSLLLGLGVVAGVGLSLWLSTFVEGLIHGLPPRDPETTIGAAIVLSAIGMVAGWLPARRAARIDPLAVLRES